MDNFKLIKRCDSCGKENEVANQYCDCGNNIEMVRPERVLITQVQKDDVADVHPVKDTISEEMGTSIIKFRRCIVCGEKNYLLEGKNVRKCFNCNNNELYKSRIEIEQDCDENGDNENSENNEGDSITIKTGESVELDSKTHLFLKSKSTDQIIIIENGGILGRMGDIGADFFENCPYVGRFHCEIKREQQSWTVKDLDSKGGTRVNGVLLKKSTCLKQGDILSLANVHFEVVIENVY